MTATSKRDEGALQEERTRLRIERLLQILTGEFDLRFAFGERDRVGDGQIVMQAERASLEDADFRFLKGGAFHLLGHYIHTSEEWAQRAQRREADVGPHFSLLWHVVEDARVENLIVARWPGIANSLRAKLPPNLGGRLVLLASRTRQIELGVYLQGRNIKGARFSQTVKDLLAKTRPSVRRAAESHRPEDVLAAVTEIYPLLAPHLRGETRSASPQPSDPAGGSEMETDRNRQDPPAKDVPQVYPEEELHSVGVISEGLPVPEWYLPGSAPWYEEGIGAKNVHPSAIQTDRETIVIPPQGNQAAYRALRSEVQRQAGFLRQRLTQLIEERQYLRFGGRFRSGKLDMSKIWKQRTGSVRLFHRRIQPGDRQTAFSLLVDESASMKAGEKIHTAAKAAVLLGEALAPLQVPLEIIGFSTDSYEAQAAMKIGLHPPHKHRLTRCSLLEHRIYKRFDEPYRIASRRLTGFQPRHNNWDEEHIEFAARRLLGQRAERYVLIVISDGQPNGDANHLKRAIADLQHLGIEVIGVGIGADFVTRIYPKAIVVENFRQLAEALVDTVANRFRPLERIAA